MSLFTPTPWLRAQGRSPTAPLMILHVFPFQQRLYIMTHGLPYLWMIQTDKKAI